MIRGLDASSVQGDLPFDLLDADIRFVILKTQQGNDGFDPKFATNMRCARARGLVVLPYAFAYPLPSVDKRTSKYVPGRDPLEQARIIVERIHAFPEMRGVTICLDLEWPAPHLWAEWGCTATQINEWCRIFCAEVARLSGRKPILYTYPHWWAEVSRGTDVSWAAEYGLWLASYPERNRWPLENERPKAPAPWSSCLFWQFDGDGGLRLPNGVDSDFCVLFGTEEELRALAAEAKPSAPVVFTDFEIVHPRVPLPTLSRDDATPDP